MIILTNCQGQQRMIPEGKPYRVMDECERHPKSSADIKVLEKDIQTESKGSIRLGDLMAGVIKSTKLDKLLGKTNCTPCKRRQVILNMAKDLGPVETARQLINTLKDNG